MYARVAGPDPAPPIVCIHGLGDNGSLFEPLFHTPLAARYRIVAVDLPGFGESQNRDAVRTIADHAQAVAAYVESEVPAEKVGLIGHSIASAIAATVAELLAARVTGLLSMEGNLLEGDAYYTGWATDFDDPREFKAAFLRLLTDEAKKTSVVHRYCDTVKVSDAAALWALGCDARRAGPGDRFGQALRALQIPLLYLWSKTNVAPETQSWIAQSGMNEKQLDGASHWPTIDRTAETAALAGDFFDACEW